MGSPKKITNLQRELLRVFSYDLPDEQLTEIKSLLSNYFLEKARDDMDQLWDDRGWSEETIKGWSQEHMRTTPQSQTAKT